MEKNITGSKVTFQNIFVGENEIHKYCYENSNNLRDIRGLISKCLKEKIKITFFSFQITIQLNTLILLIKYQVLKPLF